MGAPDTKCICLSVILRKIRYRVCNPLVAITTLLPCLVQIAVREEYDKVIKETEGAYEQIVQSSQTLLTILKKECSNINRKQQVAQVA
jgi:hypothetical protein